MLTSAGSSGSTSTSGTGIASPLIPISTPGDPLTELWLWLVQLVHRPSLYFATPLLFPSWLSGTPSHGVEYSTRWKGLCPRPCLLSDPFPTA